VRGWSWRVGVIIGAGGLELDMFGGNWCVPRRGGDKGIGYNEGNGGCWGGGGG
jgi:hypothetical protein